MAKLSNIPADCEFPQLFEIADPVKLVAKLNQHLGPAFAAREMQVSDCAIDQLNYRPGAACVVLFSARIVDRSQHELGRQSFYGKLFRKPRVMANTIKRQQNRAWVQPRFGAAMVHIPDWAMLLWAYPNDPRLPGLARMSNPEMVLAEAQAAPKKFGLTQPPVAITAEQTKYVPGMRCGYIYRMTLADGSVHAVYGKTYEFDDGENAFGLMQQIWQSEACQRGDFILPQPYSYDPGMKVLWQEALAGEPFAKIAAHIPNLPEVAEAIGARLAAFHGTALPLPRKMTFEFQVEEVRRAIAEISRAFPDYAERCAEIGEKLFRAAGGLGAGSETPVHASFKFSHIFATPKGIAFIDFDGANLGDPGYDVGRFIAHLYKMKASWAIDPDVAERTVANFCSAYNRAAASPLPQERINWFAASHLVASQIYKSVKRMDTSLVNKLLRLADRLCA